MKKDKTFICECDKEFLRVQKFEYDKNIYLSKYISNTTKKFGLFNRIKLAFNFIIRPEKYDINQDIILSNKAGRNLGKFLIEITEKNKIKAPQGGSGESSRISS